MDKMLLTVAEVCNATHLGETTVKALISRGAIESITVGRARRIPAQALAAWVQRERELQAVERGN